MWGSHARGILAVTGQRVALAGRGMTLPTCIYPLVTDLGAAWMFMRSSSGEVSFRFVSGWAGDEGWLCVTGLTLQGWALRLAVRALPDGSAARERKVCARWLGTI